MDTETDISELARALREAVKTLDDVATYVVTGESRKSELREAADILHEFRSTLHPTDRAGNCLTCAQNHAEEL